MFDASRPPAARRAARGGGGRTARPGDSRPAPAPAAEPAGATRDPAARAQRCRALAPTCLPPLVMLMEAEEAGHHHLGGFAAAERPPARGRARRFRGQGRDHQRTARPGRHALRTRAGPGYQVVARHRPRRRHRPLDVGDLGPRRRGAGPQRHRHRTAEPAPRDGFPARIDRQPGFRQIQAVRARHRARQEHRRRADHRRSRQDAASARRRHHRLRQVGRHQHDDPLAALPAEAGAVPDDHGRSEDARTLRLRRHPASADPCRDRPEEGRRRAEMGGTRDGGSLQEDVEARRPQHRRLQCPRRGRRRQGRDPDAHRADRLTTARPARPSTSTRRWTWCRCPTSWSSSTKWPT